MFVFEVYIIQSTNTLSFCKTVIYEYSAKCEVELTDDSWFASPEVKVLLHHSETRNVDTFEKCWPTGSPISRRTRFDQDRNFNLSNGKFQH